MNNREDARVSEMKTYILSHVKMGIQKMKDPKYGGIVAALLAILFIYLQTHSFTIQFGLGVPIWMTVMNLILVAEAFLAIAYFVGAAPVNKRIEQKLHRIGLVNSLGITPYLKTVIKHKKFKDMIFEGNGVPLHIWEEKLFELEHVLNCHTIFVRYMNGKKDIVLRCAPASSPFKNTDLINIHTTPKGLSTYTLGRSADGEEVLVDLSKTPHALIAGATGSGKTILMVNLLLQSVIKRNRDKDYDSEIIIADLKGGVDYQGFWEEEATLCLDEKSFLRELTRIVGILEFRKLFLRQWSARNILEFNEKYPDNILPVILVACDEIVEVLDKTGADTNRKEMIKQIEAKISTIARQGRAFGIHLILGTQRPDSDVLNGQIKNNLQIRIAGVCDEPLARVIGITEAHKMIPKNTPGRFINNDKLIFHGYFINDDLLPDILEEARGTACKKS